MLLLKAKLQTRIRFLGAQSANVQQTRLFMSNNGIDAPLILDICYFKRAKLKKLAAVSLLSLRGSVHNTQAYLHFVVCSALYLN